MNDCEVLQYDVETWDSEKRVWEWRYHAIPSYRYLIRVRKVGHLWWKSDVEEWVVISGRQARRRALSKAIRRANSLLRVDKVRIVMVITSPEVVHDVRRLIWAGGKFVV